MPRIGGKNKMYSFKHYDLISNASKAVACHLGMGESELIEGIIIKSLLPEHPTAKSLASGMLFANDGGTADTIVAIFQLAAAGVNVPDDLMPFIEFARKQELERQTALNGDEPDIYHLVSQADSIMTYLDEIATERGIVRRTIDDIELCKSLIHDLKTAPSCCRIFNFYNIVLHNWDDLKDLSITYRLLADLAKLARCWDESLDKKAELLDILKAESAKWSDKAFMA